MSNPVDSSCSGNLESVEQFFNSDVASLIATMASLEKQIDPEAMPQRNNVFHLRLLRAIQDSVVACKKFQAAHKDDPALIREVQLRFLKETDPWFRQSWFAHRARTKPAGFVGDHEMLSKLYDQATPARGFGGYIDLCFFDLQLARAVVTRLAAVRDFLLQEIESRSGEVNVLNVASGPCREYHNWPELRNQRVRVVAMDSDPAALEHVGGTVCPQLSETIQIQPERYNALRTRSADKTVSKFGKFDIIYSVGLCDYLTDDILIGMLAAWRDTLADGGVMYVAFKNTLEYDEIPYQWHLDWFFYQRTDQDVLDLYEKAGFNTSSIEMTKDATGIITNYVYRKSVTSDCESQDSYVQHPASPK